MLLNPAETVVDLAAALEDAGPAPGSPQAVFAAAVRRWLSGEAESLDEALELKGSVGIDKARSRYLRAERDRHLRTAHAICAGDSSWSRSVSLAHEVGRFSSVLWPRWRHRDTPPAGCSELRRHLFLAAQCGKLPESPARLREICTANPPY